MKHFIKMCIYTSVSISLLLSIASCSDASISPNITTSIPSKESVEIFTDNSSVNSSTIHTSLSSGILVDADLSIPSNINLNSLSTYGASLATFNFDELKKILLANKQIIDEISEETSESRTNSPYRYCNTSDNFALSSVGENLYFTGDTERKISLLFDNSEDGNSTQFENDADLDFSTRKEAQEEVERIMQELKISSESSPTCYVLDYESLTQECEKYNEYMNATFDGAFPPIQVEKGDECYIFIYQLTPFGLPISTHENGMFGEGSWTSGTYFQCTYSADGLIAVQVPYQFTDIVEKVKDNVGMSMEQALNCLDQKYNSIILEGDYLLDKIEFEYVPIPNFGSKNSYTLQPAWRFSMIHSFNVADKLDPYKQITVNQRTTTVFDAITGKELVIDYG